MKKAIPHRNAQFENIARLTAEYQAAGNAVLSMDTKKNDARSYLFKQDLQTLADELGIEIRVAHYPPYCSKYNPIEYRCTPLSEQVI
jgi:hypothetical protein